MGKGLFGGMTSNLDEPIQELLAHMKRIAENSETIVAQNKDIIKQNEAILEAIKDNKPPTPKPMPRPVFRQTPGTEIVDAVGKPHPDVVETTSPIQAGTILAAVEEAKQYLPQEG